MSQLGRRMSRRTLLRSGGLAAAVGLGALIAARAPAEPLTRGKINAPDLSAGVNQKSVFVGKQSRNGWEMEKGANIGGSIWTRPVEGSQVSVDVRIPDVEVVLVYVLRRFNYEIGVLRKGDIVGFRQYTTSMRTHETNHASGTAIDIRPKWYPRGVKGGFFPDQLAVIRDILDKCDGVVVWGGDFDTPDEAHFEVAAHPSGEQEDITVNPATSKSVNSPNSDLSRVAQKIRQWNKSPGEGAGS